MLTERRSGILLHPTSLPGEQHVGSFGREAYAFVDFLAATGQSVWQLLPINPTGYGNCPYSCFSAFAGNPLLIDLKGLAAQGDLIAADLPPPVTASDKVDFTAAYKIQGALLHKACTRFLQQATDYRRQQFQVFCEQQQSWLDDYALFETIRCHQQYHVWQQWPQPLRDREPAALASVRRDYAQEITWHKYVQFVFFEQWFALTDYARSKGIHIFGDLPIFVAENSADIWANTDLFHLDERGYPTLAAGVPPDYFSATGQRWGNPLYRWDRLREQDFSWWLERFRWNFKLFDMLRVDHFRGFAACWAIPAHETTAVNGYWLETPGRELFERLQSDHEKLPILAEDLGIITPDVVRLRDDFSFPGMKILQFAFDSGAGNPYLPHNHVPDCVIYTGTHDNNTTLGWWRQLDAGAKQRVRDYLRRPCQEMPWPLIETALMSVAKLAIVPLQDILGLSTPARMNTPGTATGNWDWRYRADALEDHVCDQLRHLTHLYGRDVCFNTEMP